MLLNPICRFVDSLMYYGLSLNMADLSGNVFFNSILSGAVEIPANLLAIALLNWPVMGRRLTCSLTLLAAGLSSFICIPLILAGTVTVDACSRFFCLSGRCRHVNVVILSGRCRTRCRCKVNSVEHVQLFQ